MVSLFQGRSESQTEAMVYSVSRAYGKETHGIFTDRLILVCSSKIRKKNQNDMPDINYNTIVSEKNLNDKMWSSVTISVTEQKFCFLLCYNEKITFT